MFKNSRGHNLIELMLVTGLVGLLGLAAASGFTFAANQYSYLQDENNAEVSLMQSAFYLRLFADQAVKVQCAPGALGGSVSLSNTTGISPVGVPDGLIDCRTSTPTPITWAAGANALGIFYRENGSSTQSPPAMSTFQAVGMYFQPPSGTASGNLIFAQQVGGTLSTTQGAVNFGHLTDIQIQSFTTSPWTPIVGGATYNMLQSISYVITVRYFNGPGIRIYDATTTNKTLFRDVSMQVNVGFHDNYLGVDLTGSGSGERLNGGVYFYKFMTPPVSTF